MSAAAQKGQPAAGHEFITTRTFEAPRTLVWKCFTEPAHMKEWWGPKGSTIVAANIDLRVGGTYHGAMRSPDGTVMWAKFVYREIVAPERLVWEHSFSDENGGLTRHPLSPTWPLKLLTIVTRSNRRWTARPSSRCAGRRSTPPKKSKRPSTRRMTAWAAAGPAHSISWRPISPAPRRRAESKKLKWKPVNLGCF
jgi:uncharacterized protein YndB with AHSA1/START domain